MPLFWGDIHNHCAISYGHGSLARALTLARQQLDFASVTGHAFWPDIPTDRDRFGPDIDSHVEGFRKLHEGWETIQSTVAAAEEPGAFIPFLSYEWHSTREGDHHVLYRSKRGALVGGNSLAELRANLQARGEPFLLEPHHIGYVRGGRGIDWKAFSPGSSPLVEVYSLHGCSESDEAPFPMLNALGPRDHRSTAQAGLALGHKFGFTASTDQHSGYPGSYGEGRVAVYADALTREALWDGFFRRRTYAVTGDKIAVDFRLNTAVMGEETTASRRQISLRAEGSDFWDTIEIVKNGRIYARWAPLPSVAPVPPSGNIRAKIRLEWGWFRVNRTVPWECVARVNDGRILAVETCFRGDPVVRQDEIASVEEKIPHAVTERSDQHVAWRSETRGNPTMRHAITQALILDVEMPANATLEVVANGYRARHTLWELLGGAYAHLTDGFLSPALQIHQAVTEQDFSFACDIVDDRPEAPVDYYYARLAQRNGQHAWITPIWVNAP